MSINIGAQLRNLVAQGVREGTAYNDLYHQVAEAGVSVTSSEFSREYRYSIALQGGETDLSGRAGSQLADVVPGAGDIIESPVAWPDRFNVRVKLFGRDTETGRFTNRWINLGYSRLPSYGSIMDTAAVLAVTGSEHYEFEFGSVSAVTIEASSDAYLVA